jgi:hypothetical protein
MSNRETAPAGLTVYDVAPDWVQGSSKFIFHEASGTVKVRPDLRDKLAKSLRREAARIQRRFLLRQLRLRLAAIPTRMQHPCAQCTWFLSSRVGDILIKGKKQLMECGVSQQG